MPEAKILKTVQVLERARTLGHNHGQRAEEKSDELREPTGQCDGMLLVSGPIHPMPSWLWTIMTRVRTCFVLSILV